MEKTTLLHFVNSIFLRLCVYLAVCHSAFLSRFLHPVFVTDECFYFTQGSNKILFDKRTNWTRVSLLSWNPSPCTRLALKKRQLSESIPHNLFSFRFHEHSYLQILGVFERRTSTGSGLFTFLGSGFAQIFGQMVVIMVKKLSNTNLVTSKHIKRKKASLIVNVRRTKTPLLKLLIIRRRERV